MAMYIRDFVDLLKERELRLRALEGAEIDASSAAIEFSTDSLSVVSSGLVIQRSIGSAFYFHIPNHNIFESSSSLLGDMRAGSTVGELT